jgi:acyl-CoA hydrolase
MKYYTRKLIKTSDLNSRGTLFGGKLLEWIDEEAGIFAICQADSRHLVTKAMSEVNFVSPVMNGDIIEFGCELLGIGNTSISVKLEVRNKTTKKKVITVNKITFVNLDKFGMPKKIK